MTFKDEEDPDGALSPPRPPETLGRRSPLYHPYLFIVVGILVTVVQVRAWLSEPRYRTAVAVDMASSGRRFVVARGLPLTPTTSQVGTASDVALVDLDDIDLRRALMRIPVDRLVVGSDRFAAISSAGVSEFEWPLSDEIGDPVSRRSYALDDVKMELLDAVFDEKGSVAVLGATTTEDGAAKTGTSLVHSAIDFGDWKSTTIRTVSPDEARFGGAAIVVRPRTVVVWAEQTLSNGSWSLHSATDDPTGWKIGEKITDLAATADRVLVSAGLADGRIVVACASVRGARTVVEVLSETSNGDWQASEKREFEAGSLDSMTLRTDPPGSSATLLAFEEATEFLELDLRTLPPSWRRTESFAPLFSATITPFDVNRVAFGIALLALILGSIEAFRRPVFSEGPRTTLPARFSKRAAAFAVDFFVAVLVSALPFLPEVLGRLADVHAVEPGADDSRLWQLALQPFLEQELWMIATIYHGVMIFLYAPFERHWGKTPGKWLLGLRVVPDSPSGSMSLLRCLVRRALLVIDIYSFTFVFAFLNNRSQRLGDIVSRTMVTDDRMPPASPEPPRIQETP